MVRLVDVRMFSGVLSLLHFITGIMCTSNFKHMNSKSYCYLLKSKITGICKINHFLKEAFLRNISSTTKNYFKNEIFKVVYSMHIKLVKLKLIAFLIKMALFKYWVYLEKLY